jgi:hypothetical protein
MRRFYQDILRFPLHQELGSQWIAYRVGSNILVLTERGLMFDDPPTPTGALSVQLAFRVPPGDVDRCAAELADAGVAIQSLPTDQPGAIGPCSFGIPTATCSRSMRIFDRGG